MTDLVKSRPQNTTLREPMPIAFSRRLRVVSIGTHQNVPAFTHSEGKRTAASWLQDSLTELEEALENAANSGIPKPEPATVEEARRVLGKIHEAAPRIYIVSLMPNGAIAIDTRGPKPDGAFITLDSDGTAYCSGEIGGKHWHKKYRRTEDLPDNTLLDELRKLG
jgi:hypothetical protein